MTLSFFRRPSFFKKAIHLFVSPVFLELYYRFQHKRRSWGLYGNYASFDLALKQSGPYQTNVTSMANALSTTYRRRSEWVYESRSQPGRWLTVTDPYHGVPCSSPFLLAMLNRFVQRNQLTALDFGGGLGEHYFFLKGLLPPNSTLNWNIVELPEMAEAGQKTFQEPGLSYFESITEAPLSDIDTVVLGGVLHYLEDPYALLHDVLSQTSASAILIDRLPVFQNKEVVKIQYAHDNKRPHWILNFQKILAILEQHHFRCHFFHEYGPFPRPFSNSCYLMVSFVKVSPV